MVLSGSTKSEYEEKSFGDGYVLRIAVRIAGRKFASVQPRYSIRNSRPRMLASFIGSKGSARVFMRNLQRYGQSTRSPEYTSPEVASPDESDPNGEDQASSLLIIPPIPILAPPPRQDELFEKYSDARWYAKNKSCNPKIRV